MLENKTITIKINYQLLEYEDKVTIGNTTFKVDEDQYEEDANEEIQKLMKKLVNEITEFDNKKIIELNSDLEDLNNHRLLEVTNVIPDYAFRELGVQLNVPTNDTDLFMKALKHGFVEYVENDDVFDVYTYVTSDYGDDIDVQCTIGLIVSARVEN